MNRKIKLFRWIRQQQRPKLLMDFSDHDGHTACMCCSDIMHAYTYLPVLGNMYVCDKHKRKWEKWGLVMFKEMINSE